MRLNVFEELPLDAASFVAVLELYGTPAQQRDITVRFTLQGVNGRDVEVKLANSSVGANAMRADSQFSLDSLPSGRFILRADVFVRGQPIGNLRSAVTKLQ